MFSSIFFKYCLKHGEHFALWAIHFIIQTIAYRNAHCVSLLHAPPCHHFSASPLSSLCERCPDWSPPPERLVECHVGQPDIVISYFHNSVIWWNCRARRARATRIVFSRRGCSWGVWHYLCLLRVAQGSSSGLRAARLYIHTILHLFRDHHTSWGRYGDLE